MDCGQICYQQLAAAHYQPTVDVVSVSCGSSCQHNSTETLELTLVFIALSLTKRLLTKRLITKRSLTKRSLTKLQTGIL